MIWPAGTANRTGPAAAHNFAFYGARCRCGSTRQAPGRSASVPAQPSTVLCPVAGPDGRSLSDGLPVVPRPGPGRITDMHEADTSYDEQDADAAPVAYLDVPTMAR